jgi:TP901 family phage tail tape measure protein
MDKIFEVGIALVAFDKMSKVIKDACGTATQAFSQLQEKIKKTSETLAVVGTASYFAGQQILNATKKPISAFMELEDASTQLKVTLMKDGGEISELFGKIDKRARELGMRLPGTTADFYKMASKLKALGVEEEAIVGGSLEAAAYLGVVLKSMGVSYEQTAEYVAKFREALGIADKDLIKFMDVIQRLAHMGVNVEEMKYAFADLAGTLKPLGLQGLEASKEVAPLVGMLIKMGKTGRTVGNALGDMIKAGMDASKVQKANEILSRYGVTLDFVDEQTGKFKGIVNLIGQLSQLRDLPEAVRMEAAKALGGAGEVADIINIIATEGIEGYNKMVNKMAKQADLQKRVDAQLGTLRNLWEAFTGTMQNSLAIIGESAAPLLKGLANLFNIIADKIGDFAEKHKTLTKIFSIGAVVIGGSLMAFGALGIALSVIMRMAGGAIGGISGFIKVVKFAIPIVGTMAKTLILATKSFAISAISAIRAVSVALFTTPIGWIILGITALVAAGYLLWRNWDKVSKALGSAWNWLKENWKKVLQVFLYISPLTAPIMAIRKLVQYIFGIDLFQAGKKIIESLWKGIQSVAMKPVEAVKSVVQKIRNFLPFSPAKEGPFRDLDKVKLIETIAGGVKAAPLIEAMKKVATQAKQPLIQPVRQMLEPVRTVIQPQGGTKPASTVTVNYSPTLNISGATAQAKEDFLSILRQHQNELLKLIQDAQNKAMRVAY